MTENKYLMLTNKLHKNKFQNGFTLIEIAIAVFMLASALVVMLGLEQSNIARTLNDQNRKVALGLARKIMSAIELEQLKINIDEEKEAKVMDFFSQNNLEFDTEDKDKLDKFQVSLKASSPEIAGFDKDNLIKLIQLRISWGDAHKENLDIIKYSEHVEND